MEKKYTALGIGSGLVAGVVSFGYARTVITPLIDTAIGYEAERSHAEAALNGAHPHDHEVFSRAFQQNVGAGAGTVLFCIVMGALFAVALTVTVRLLQRSAAVSQRCVAAWLAVAAFVSITLVPALAYPPNPPGVGLEQTIGDRTTAYLVIVLASVALAVVATVIGVRLTAKFGAALSATLSFVGYALAMCAVAAALPSFHEVPLPLTAPTGELVFGGFPAELLSDFRIGSLVGQAIMWAVIGAGFALLLPGRRQDFEAAPTTNGTKVLHGHR